jgi:outer membrane lipoprotein-sorting protein
MKRLLFLLLILAALVCESGAADQSASKIVDRFKKASGGKSAARVKSTTMTGSVKGGDGTAGRFSYQTSAPNNLRLDLELGGSKVSECYNGKSAWRLDARGLRTLLGDEAKRLRLESLLSNSRLNDLQRNRIVPQLAGKTTIDGREANAIEFIKDGVRVKLFFDASTNLPLKRERETADGVEETFYGDYRAVDGVMEPFSLKIKKGASELLVTIERVEHSRVVELAAFRYPRIEGSRPLPELEPLMKAVTENQDKVDEMRERYTCRLDQIDRKHDGDGRIKETETRTFEVTPIGEKFVRRLISVNGKELSASEREKEDKRVQNAVEDIIKRREKKEQKEERSRAKGEKEKKDDGDVEIKDFLRISEITSVRREMFRGHEVIAFDFEPRKGFKPKTRAEDIVNKLAGTIWVDETAKQVARLEARLTDSFKLGGGVLASIGASTAFSYDQEKIDDEVWMPSSMEANISARVLLLAKLNHSVERRYSEYKKYQIDSKYDLTKPKENAKP